VSFLSGIPQHYFVDNLTYKKRVKNHHLLVDSSWNNCFLCGIMRYKVFPEQPKKKLLKNYFKNFLLVKITYQKIIVDVLVYPF
jgi:hypothetical protein